jgi:outer membrane receptor for ferrienterochelin and colicins
VLTENIDNLGDKKREVFKPYAFDDYYLTNRYEFSLYGERWTKAKNLIQTTVGWNIFQRIKNSYRYNFDDDKKSLIEGMQDTSSAQGFLTRFTFASDKKERKWNYLIGLENYYETATGTRLLDTHGCRSRHRVYK